MYRGGGPSVLSLDIKNDVWSTLPDMLASMPPTMVPTMLDSRLSFAHLTDDWQNKFVLFGGTNAYQSSSQVQKYVHFYA